jgi:hypothetical protein
VNKLIDDIWQYSHYYGDMLFTSLRLHDNEEDYAAILVLFNAMELICKSVRENYNQNFLGSSLYWMVKRTIITVDRAI